MSFTDQKARTATEEDLKAPWSGGINGRYFRCKLCGYHFQLGDYWRWVFMGKEHYTNIIVCESCDTSDVKEKWIKANKDWERMKEASPFWWFITNLEEAVKGI